MNVLNIYGQQECRIHKDTIEKHWNELLEVISQVEARQELLVIIGDANRAVGNVIPLNDTKVSYGGQMIRTLLDTDKYVLVNGTDKVIGGPATRENPANPTSKSALDLVIVSVELEKYIESMEIDENKTFTPFRTTKNGTIKLLIITVSKSLSAIYLSATEQVKSQENSSSGTLTNQKVGRNTKS